MTDTELQTDDDVYLALYDGPHAVQFEAGPDLHQLVGSGPCTSPGASSEEPPQFGVGFERDGFFGSFGAYNGTGGEYEADRSGRLYIDLGFSTLVGCEPGRRLCDVEGAFGAALDAAERFETDGRTLQITGRDGAAVRLRTRAD